MDRNFKLFKLKTTKMAQNKTGTQGMGGKPGGQHPSKVGSQKQGAGTSRKSSMKEDENDNSSSGKGTMNK